MQTKPFWQSKTLYLNIGALVLAVLGGDYGVIPGVDPAVLAKVVMIGNVVLRFVTTSAVSVK